MCLGLEISGLIREIYYAKNTIILNNLRWVGNFFLPPYEARKYVKTLVLPWLLINDPKHWNIIKAFNRHAFGFSTLMQVTVCLSGNVQPFPPYPSASEVVDKSNPAKSLRTLRNAAFGSCLYSQKTYDA
jgi:hypothetical protein